MEIVTKERNGIRVGSAYKLHHTRKGNAVVKVIAINGEWIEVEVISGRLMGIGAGSLREAGERDTLRECHCGFEELQSS